MWAVLMKIYIHFRLTNVKDLRWNWPFSTLSSKHRNDIRSRQDFGEPKRSKRKFYRATNQRWLLDWNNKIVYLFLFQILMHTIWWHSYLFSLCRKKIVRRSFSTHFFVHCFVVMLAIIMSGSISLIFGFEFYDMSNTFV